MKKTFTVAILLTAFLSSSTIISQNTIEQDLLNMKKYWYYHYRLVNDFMVKGDCQGCSETMSQRSFKEQGDPNPAASIIAKWGDNTINLGHYVAVLATEYKLLKDQGQPTDTTIQELYYAIRAFNRLDKLAEVNIANATHTTPLPTDINGFFIRDDIPQNFLETHPKLARGTTSLRSVSIVKSDFIEPNLSAKEMSHDQIWYMFTGFSLVSKFVDDNVTYQGKELNDLTHNPYIRQEVRDITDRIITRLINNGWVVKNPNSGVWVNRGPQVGLLSYGAAEAACFIKNPIVDPPVKLFPVVHTCEDFHNYESELIAPLWMLLGKTPGLLYTLSTEDYKPQQIAAVGNSWYTSAFLVIPNPVTIIKKLFDKNNLKHPFKYIKQIIQTPPIYPINMTEPELGARAILRHTEHLPLLRQVLHGGGNLISSSTYRSMLNSAPCEGPRCYWNSNGECSTSEWSSSDRLHNSEERIGASNPHGISAQGEYCGLDYMLYYNLYHIIVPNTVPNINYMDRVITIPYPTSGQLPIGTTTIPAIVEAFNSITAYNIVNSNAVVTYRAGNEVALLPGFTAKSGSDFRAYVDPFHCSSETNTYELHTRSDNPTRTATQSVMDNLVAYNGPTTYVNYPKADNTTENYSENENTVSQNNEKNTMNATVLVSKTTMDVFPKAISASTISISPNPNKGSFTVGFKGNTLNSKLTVFDLLGNTVLSKQLNDLSTIIDISNQPKGIYYIKVENTEGIRFEKIIFQ